MTDDDTTPSTPGLLRGERATAHVLDEPFWGAVRRRHPDLDIVLLPPHGGGAAGRPEPPPGPPLPVERTALVADEADARADDVWAAWSVPVAGEGDAGGDEEQPHRSGRWTLGEAHGTLRREVTREAASADPVRSATSVERGVRRLRTDGWQVTVPDGGMPRAHARRGEGNDREDVLLLVVPASGRLVARYTSPSVHVDVRHRRHLLAGEHVR